MQRTLSPWFITLCAALLMLVSSTALAASGADACNLLTSGSCKFVTTPATCEGQCTPPSFVAECDGECSAAPPTVSCTGTCSSSCMASCTANPPAFDCTQSCTANCQASCTTVCNGEGPGCASDCMLDCPNRCGVQCHATPPTADCSAKCQASCDASCQVQANIDCHATCTASIAPATCSLDCQGPSGAVFCGTPPQYVNLAKAAGDCLTYLQSQGITITTTCKVGQGCTTSGGCSAALVPGASATRWGVLGIVGLLMGAGLVLSRRRRRVR